MKRAVAVILFTLFNLGVFGVTIEQHFCCHSQEEGTASHCTDDESCCGDKDDCCDEIVSQVKIAKDYNSNDLIQLQLDVFTPSSSTTFYADYVAPVDYHTTYAAKGYFPPPINFQIAYCTFLI